MRIYAEIEVPVKDIEHENLPQKLKGWKVNKAESAIVFDVRTREPMLSIQCYKGDD